MRGLVTRLVLDPPTPYDGSQLHPHFLRHQFGVLGDAAVAFRGPCRVEGARLVDLADRESGAFIFSPDMLHVMVEQFGPDLPRTVLLQRLLAAMVAESLTEDLRTPGPRIQRRGDDVYVEGGKLTVSIATVSPVSSLIHFGINIDGRGAPVPTADLLRLGVEPGRFAQRILEALAAEVRGTIDAVCKVVPAHPAVP